MRIASYNVKGFPWEATPIAKIVRWATKRCDIIALQEVWCSRETWKTMFAAVGWSIVFPPREGQLTGMGSGLAFAYRSTDWKIQDIRSYPYISSIGIDQLATKGWLRIEAYHVPTQQSMRLITTHTQSDYQCINDYLQAIGTYWSACATAVRIKQAQQLAEIECRQTPKSTLILGDFNSETCLIPNTRFLRTNKDPTFLATGECLDHCATWSDDTRWKLTSHTVYKAPYSDHCPIIWTFDLGGAIGS